MREPQRGVFLIEALVALLIFSIGILGLVSLGAVAISAQSDAQYRTEAANLANKVVAEIALDIRAAATPPSCRGTPITRATTATATSRARLPTGRS